MSLEVTRLVVGAGARRAAHRSVRVWRLTLCLAIAGTAAGASRLPAQAEHQQHDSMAAQATRISSMPGMPPMAGMPQRPFGIPMTRMGSGTTWLPDASAMRAWHFTAGAWMLMVHGDAFLQFDHQGGPEGTTRWGASIGEC